MVGKEASSQLHLLMGLFEQGQGNPSRRDRGLGGPRINTSMAAQPRVENTIPLGTQMREMETKDDLSLEDITMQEGEDNLLL